MGNELSHDQRSPVYIRLDKAIPTVRDRGSDTGTVRLFKSTQEREDFIFSLITVLSSNNTIPLESRDFKIMYTRRKPEPPNPALPQSNSTFSWPTKKPVDRIFASLVLVDEQGSIRSKVEPELGGKDHAEAFQLFRKHVEVMLDNVLAEVAPVSAEPVADRPADRRQRTQNQQGGQPVSTRRNEGQRPSRGETPMGGVLFDAAPPSYEKSQSSVTKK